jgi:flagellar biosynthetic protein FliR
MLSAMPLIGGRLLPTRVRLGLAVALTWVLLPLVGPAPRVDPLSPAAVLVVANQVLIGAAMGLALQVMFNALVVGGQIIGASMGLGFASVVDPQNGVQVPVVSQLYFLLGALIFLALDGHLTVVELLARSFVTLPVDGRGLDPQHLRALALWGAFLFSEGMHLALPVVSVLLLTNLALGVATRAAPQLNVFALGFSITLMLGLMSMLLSLGNLGTLFTGMLTRTFSMIAALVAA